jgi:inner membrane protein
LGESVRIFDYQHHLPNLNKDSQQRKDIERFRWFSQDYLGFDKEKSLVTDVRYSMIPNQIAPIWGLVINDQQGINEHAVWWASRGLGQGQLDVFKEMISGKKCRENVLAF